ncbi:MAG: BatD family protein [Halioglobus sp.]|nr:BatD family protein [Halioglobus sp.]
MKHRLHWLARVAITVAICFPTLTFSASIEELLRSGNLRIDSALAPDTLIVPGQRVTLTLEIATDRWFSGGTRIGIPEVPGLVILQTEQFASNASETQNGQTWVIQRWTLDIYPQRAGNFTVGPILLQVQVNAGETGEVKGELLSPSAQFRVTIPKSLEKIEQWVAAPTFTVHQRFDSTLENLAEGDAFEQEIVFEASDVLAMMLPTYEVEQQPGLRAYPSPVAQDNSVNRGETLARRHFSISYVVEQMGQFSLPAREYSWWNTKTAQLELLSVPATTIVVAGVGTAEEAITKPFTISPRQIALVIISLIGVALFGRVAKARLQRLPLDHATALWSSLASRWRALRKPALASRLNPGSSAED